MKIRFSGLDFDEDSLEKVLKSYVVFMCDLMEEDLQEVGPDSKKAA